jgi:hypothetical protein
VKAKLKGKISRSGWVTKKNEPKGDSSDLMDPCMQAELDANPKAVDSWSSDHLKDLQFGGNPNGPFKMMSSRVNSTLGSQMSNGPATITEFRTEGCD